MLTVRRAKSFIRYFTAEDLVDVALEVNGNAVQAFTINYRAFIAGSWHEVVRYDNAHAKPLHIHRFWPPTKGRREYLEDEIRADYTDAVEEALADLEEHWQRFRHHVESNLDAGEP